MSTLVICWRIALIVACSVSLPVPAGAAAQEPGVVYDPDSPAGKEYALPLEAARRDGQPVGARRDRVSDAPLFGAGLTVMPTTSATDSSGSTNSTGGDPRDARSGSETDVGSGDGSSPKAGSSTSSARSGSVVPGSVQETIGEAAGTQAWTGGLIGVGAGLLALLGGLGLRRARRGREST